MQIVMMLSLGSGLTYTLGRMTGSQRHGWAVWAAMALLCLAGVTVIYAMEAHGNPLLHGIDQHASAMQPGGNMEGKEVRFGIANTALFATTTTDASCGAVNGMHDSFTPLGGMVPLVNIMIGEVIFGGVGAGLYGIVVFIVLSVFIAGLMVGRTPEYLGKKIEAYDVKMAMITVLVFCLLVLCLTGVAIVSPFGTSSISNAGPHGLSQILYAYTSMAGNNGSAFAGLNGNTPWYNVSGAFDMLLGRFLHGDSGARDGRKPGAKENRSGIVGDIPGYDAAFHVPAHFSHLDRQRTDIFPGAQPGPDPGAPADARRKGFLRQP